MITFDGSTKRIILDSTTTSAAEIWSRWADWHATNANWPLAFRQVGGDDLGGGLSIPPYFFLLNGWRVRPMESNHTLVITGNLFVDGGGVPVVQTLGSFQVNVNYTVPVQAQGIATGGGGGGAWGDIMEGTLTYQDALKLLVAEAMGKTEIVGNVVKFKSLDGLTDRITGTMTGSARTTVVLNPD
jgi:hypothetical protein